VILLRCAVAVVAVASAAGSASAQAQYGAQAAPQGPAKAHTAASCPWLTEGSAAHALGGDVVVTVTPASKDAGSCRFVKQPEGKETLEILVGGAIAHTCPADSLQLKGIGNEASRCRVAGSRDAEMVEGRVRELSFTVVLRSGAQKGAGKPDDPRDDALEQIAEQVAGNLY
jgi:hypothetical protein